MLVATSSFVGYHLAEDKARATLPLGLQFLGTMLTTIPASMFMKHVAGARVSPRDVDDSCSTAPRFDADRSGNVDAIP